MSYITYALMEGSEDGSEQIQQLVIALLWRILQVFTNQQWHPTMVNFTFKRPPVMSQYRRAFDVPIMFDADFCGLIFHSSDLSIELPGHNESLHQALLNHAAEIAQRRPRELTEQVRILIRKNLEMQKVGEETITQFLPYEARTLQRKLKRSGTNYRSLLNEVRLDLGMEWLSNSDIPITRIAEHLCYSSLATMTRAFKTQTGMSPKAWRKMQSHLTQNDKKRTIRPRIVLDR